MYVCMYVMSCLCVERSMQAMDEYKYETEFAGERSATFERMVEASTKRLLKQMQQSQDGGDAAVDELAQQLRDAQQGEEVARQLREARQSGPGALA